MSLVICFCVIDIDINSCKMTHFRWSRDTLLKFLAKKRCVTCVTTSDNICYLSYRWIPSRKIKSVITKPVISLFTPIDTFLTRKNSQTKQHIIEVGHLVILSCHSCYQSMTYAVVEATSVNSSRGNLLLIWESGSTKLYNDVRLSPVSLKWGATLQPDNCHKLSFSSSANGGGKRAQASVKQVRSDSFAFGFRSQFSSRLC